MVKPLPGGYEIRIEVQILKNSEVQQQGVLLVGETDDVKDFKLAGLAAQRGVYEMLSVLWQQLSQVNNVKLH